MDRGADGISRYYRLKFDAEYDRILEEAEAVCPEPPEPADRRRGRKKKGKERSLIERLKALKDAVCLFLRKFIVPFDNNQAERDVRNVKTKTKVSGCFRTTEGAQDYLGHVVSEHGHEARRQRVRRPDRRIRRKRFAC